MMSYPDLPTCIKGGVKIGPGFDGECSAPTITRLGHNVGVYLDDTTPNLEHWIEVARAKYPTGLIVVGISMSTPHLRHPGVVNAQEWYPVHSGEPLWAWGRMPKCEAYIIQDRFPGFSGRGAPNRLQRLALLAQVRIQRPRFIFQY